MVQVLCLKCHFSSNQVELNGVDDRLHILVLEKENKRQCDCMSWFILNSRGKDFKLSLLTYAYLSIYFAF